MYLLLKLYYWWSSNVFFTDQKPSNTKAMSASQQHQSKFLEVKLLIMPQSFFSWVEASKRVGKCFDKNQKSRPGVSRDYILPDPALFLNHQNKYSRQSFFKTYLKRCDMLLYIIDSLDPLLCLRSPATWHRVLGLELHGQKSDSREGQLRCQIRNDLNKVVSKSSSTLVCLFSFLSGLGSGLNSVLADTQFGSFGCCCGFLEWTAIYVRGSDSGWCLSTNTTRDIQHLIQDQISFAWSLPLRRAVDHHWYGNWRVPSSWWWGFGCIIEGGTEHQDHFIAVLRQMFDYERERKNNILRNKELFAEREKDISPALLPVWP